MIFIRAFNLFLHIQKISQVLNAMLENLPGIKEQ